MFPGISRILMSFNYKSCEDTECACDSYCCDTTWDLSHRGYKMYLGDVFDKKNFKFGFSARAHC